MNASELKSRTDEKLKEIGGDWKNLSGRTGGRFVIHAVTTDDKLRIGPLSSDNEFRLEFIEGVFDCYKDQAIGALKKEVLRDMNERQSLLGKIKRKSCEFVDRLYDKLA